MSEAVLDFQKIYDDFRPKIHRYLTRLIGEYESEDLTQEVFVKIHRALHTFRGESKLSTWIYRIATHAALDRLRAPSFRQIVQYERLDVCDTCEKEIDDKDVVTREEVASLEQQLFRKERSECYRDFIDNLPMIYRTVVALSELEGLTTNAISEILGLSPEVVKIRLHRGRARLLQELKSHCKAEDWL